MIPNARDLPVDLAYDLKDAIEERAVLCVTGAGTAKAVHAALADLGHTRPIEITARRGLTMAGFAHTLYDALHLEVAHGPAPAEVAATNRRIDAHLARSRPLLVLKDSEALRRDVLQDLVHRWKHTPGPCPLILTGTDRLRAALAAAALDTLVYIWHKLDSA
ncbi:hypothetical protein [Streptomyces noursei]|uniref:hypothetical protein n=1 Tax=Streptomyces noursei TaxID=1971 RepID=UPI003801F613